MSLLLFANWTKVCIFLYPKNKSEVSTISSSSIITNYRLTAAIALYLLSFLGHAHGTGFFILVYICSVTLLCKSGVRLFVGFELIKVRYVGLSER